MPNPVNIEEIEHIAVTQNVDLQDTFVANENIGGHKAVYLNNGKISIASNDNTDCLNKVIGFTTHAGNIETSIKVKRFGIIELTGWGLTTNSIYYLGLNGNITATMPNNGIYQILGTAKSPNELEINIQIAINRG